MTGFRVIASDAVQAQFRKLAASAAVQGRGEEFLAAYQRLMQRLETDPLEFGEPRYQLPALGLEMRRAAVAPLLINYGVNLHQRFVVVQAVDLMSP